MTIQNDIQKERKELLLLLAEIPTKHKHLEQFHLLGSDESCKLCHLFNQIKTSDDLLKEKLILIQQDNLLIKEFNTLRRNLGRIPDENEFSGSKEAVDHFGSWYDFLVKTGIRFKNL